jgi:YHS domain-containing protein
MRTPRSMLATSCLLLASLTGLSLGFAPPIKPAAPSETAPKERVTREKTPAVNAAGFVGDAYPLDTCPVAGEKLGDDAVTVVLKDQKDTNQNGRQLKFCCEKCVEKFNANPSEYIAKVDAEIIKAKGDAYPLDHCLLMKSEKLESDAQAIVYGNRVYKTCCKKCLVNFAKNPARYAEMYEKAVIEAQRASYPLTTCVVADEPLTKDGKASSYDFVVGHQLVRTCCADCAKKVIANPGSYLAKISAAKAKAPATK